MANNIVPNQKLTQHERILRWFDTHASLTRWEAPARISELKKQGYDFQTKLEGGISESGYSFLSAVWTLER